MKRFFMAACVVYFLGACNDNTTGDNNRGSIDSNTIQPSDTIGNPANRPTDSGSVIQKDSGYKVAKPTPADTGRQ